MKKASLGFLLLSLFVFGINQARADHYHSYSFHGSYPLDPRQYDPYYYLHQIHYQLYRQQQRPSYCVQGFVIGGWPKENRPQRQEREDKK